MSFSNAVQPLRQPEPTARIRRVFIRDLVLDASIGVYGHEKDKKQRIRINVDLTVSESEGPIEDRLANVVCYEEIATEIRSIVGAGHVNLVETLAEEVAQLCLADSRVRSARVRVEKLDVFQDAASVGVEIERFNATT